MMGEPRHLRTDMMQSDARSGELLDAVLADVARVGESVGSVTSNGLRTMRRHGRAIGRENCRSLDSISDALARDVARLTNAATEIVETEERIAEVERASIEAGTGPLTHGSPDWVALVAKARALENANASVTRNMDMLTDIEARIDDATAPTGKGVPDEMAATWAETKDETRRARGESSKLKDDIEAWERQRGLARGFMFGSVGTR